MTRQDKSRRNPTGFRWSLLGFSYRPRSLHDIRVELRKLDEYEPPAEMAERDRKKHLEEKELARIALLEEIQAAEYLGGKPWLSHAPLIFWLAATITVILIWLLVKWGA